MRAIAPCQRRGSRCQRRRPRASRPAGMTVYGRTFCWTPSSAAPPWFGVCRAAKHPRLDFGTSVRYGSSHEQCRRGTKLMLRQLLTVVALGSAASAVFAAEQDCFQARDHQLRIEGCSQIIQRDPNDATAYHNRAFARGLAGDIDNAIVGLLQGHRDRTGKRQRLRQSWSRIRQQRRVHTCGCGSDQSPRIDRQGDGAADGCSPAADGSPSQPTGAPPPPTGAAKVPKAPKKAVAARKAPTVPPKEKAIPEASTNVVEEPPTSSWWSWLWGNNAGANPAAGKYTKP